MARPKKSKKIEYTTIKNEIKTFPVTYKLIPLEIAAEQKGRSQQALKNWAKRGKLSIIKKFIEGKKRPQLYVVSDWLFWGMVYSL